MESVIYEGHGPAATGFIVECLTDNRKRTAPALRHLFTKYGGDLGVVGSVGWMFDTKGWFEIDPATAGKSADELMELAVRSSVPALPGHPREPRMWCHSSRSHYVIPHHMHRND